MKDFIEKFLNVFFPTNWSFASKLLIAIAVIITIVAIICLIVLLCKKEVKETTDESVVENPSKEEAPIDDLKPETKEQTVEIEEAKETKKEPTKEVKTKKPRTKKTETEENEVATKEEEIVADNDNKTQEETTVEETKTEETTTEKANKEEKVKTQKYMVTYDKENKEWVIKKTGATRASKRCKTKKEAMEFVEKFAENQDLNVSVKKKDGKFQKKSNIKK